MRLTSQIVETEYGTYDVYKYVEEKIECEECTKCKNKCEFGYKATEIIIDG